MFESVVYQIIVYTFFQIMFIAQWLEMHQTGLPSAALRYLI